MTELTQNPPSFDFFNTFDIKGLSAYIEDPSKEVWKEENQGGNTILHRAAFLDSDGEMTEAILKSLNTRLDSDKETIKEFVNKQNINKLTALHFASQRGKYKIIRTLLDNGADINTKDKDGYNVMHHAAKGDQPTSLTYFIEKQKMNINKTDNKGRTPLHVAAMEGKDLTIPFLVCWGAKIDAQDENGKTPLHLAIEKNQIKAVKKLCRLGADKRIRDFKDMTTPTDLAMSKTDNPQMLDIFKKRTLCEELFYRPEITKTKFRKANTIFFFITHIILTVVNIIFFQPILNSLTVFYVYVGVIILIFMMFIILSCSNPGKVYNKRGYKLIDYVLKGKNTNVSEYCPYCCIIQNNQTTHCVICGVCVDGFDHHCFWVDNCIGRDNYLLFFIFLVFVNCNIIFNIEEIIRALVIGQRDDDDYWNPAFGDLPFTIPVKALFVPVTRWCVGLFVLIICFAFLPATLWMLKWQLSRVCSSERIVEKRKDDILPLIDKNEEEGTFQSNNNSIV